MGSSRTSISALLLGLAGLLGCSSGSDGNKNPAPPAAPTAAFGAQPTTGEAPLAVAFTDLSSGNVTSWAWDFGDGGGASVSDPSHVYANPGTYTVSLTVQGAGGSDTSTAQDLVDAQPPPGPLCPDPGNAGFSVVPDVLYGTDPGPCGFGQACLDVYLPDTPRACTPTVLFLHGGGWNGGSKGNANAVDIASRLALAGWTTVTVDYELASFAPCSGGIGSGSYPEAIHDAKRAVDWVHAVGTQSFGLSDSVVLVGNSAGGLFASLLGATQGPGEDFFDPDALGDYGVDRVVVFSGPANLVKIGCVGNPWSASCVASCPGPPGPPQMCMLPLGCNGTGGWAAGYPCLADSGNCFNAVAPEVFLGLEWPLAGVPAGVDCGDPLALPGAFGSPPTLVPWYDASPLFWISGEEPPFHLFHGECDALVPSYDSVDLAAALTADGVTHELTIEPANALCGTGCQHGDVVYGTEGIATRVADILLRSYGP